MNMKIAGGNRQGSALYESEGKFRVLAEMSSAVIYVYQGESLVYVNEATERITGYSKDELLKKKFWEIVHPDFQNLVRERGLARQYGKPVPSCYEIKFLTKGGELRWAELTAGRIELNGKPAGIATFFDITERKRVGEMLWQANMVIENSPVVLFRWKASEGWPVALVSQNVKQFGYDPEEFNSGAISYASIVYAGDLERVTMEVRMYSANGTDQFRQEYRILTRDGRVRWVDDRTVIERDANGAITHYQGIILDITERKEAEEALWESERRNAALLDAIPDIMFVQSLEGDYLDYMSHDASLLAIPPDRIVGKNVRDTGFSEETISLVLQYNKKAVETRELQRFEYDLAVPAGLRSFEARLIALTDREVLSIVRDITERKRAEEELKEAKKQAELYLDLMGHDINNMHQIALGYLELALEECADAGKKVLLQTPIEVLQRSARLIDNVRKLQKLKEGVFQMLDMDVCQTLIEVQREFGSVPNKAVKLNTNGLDHCYVKANELLYDVFANLLENAIKHTKDHARITAALDAVNDNGDSYYRVVVEDDGPGISDGFKRRIFNRVLESPSREKGIGLGLYLVKSLVESYNGYVWVEDRVQGDYTMGVRFVVLLPANNS